MTGKSCTCTPDHRRYADLADQALVTACLDGREEAWEELVARYQRLVFSIPLHYGLSEDQCSDVFQDVFLALLQQMPKLRDRQSLAKWLITTSHRTAWQAIRRSRTSGGMESVDQAPEHEPALPPAELAELWERQHLLRRSMHRLDERCRNLLTALYLDPAQPDYQTIAERLDMPVGSIGPSRARCLGKLVRIARSLGLADAR